MVLHQEIFKPKTSESSTRVSQLIYEENGYFISVKEPDGKLIHHYEFYIANSSDKSAQAETMYFLTQEAVRRAFVAARLLAEKGYSPAQINKIISTIHMAFDKPV